jgi:hypothetical protein
MTDPRADRARESYVSRIEREKLAALALIDEQVADGSLTIRPMTPEERERYGPPRSTKARRSVRKRKSLSTPHVGDRVEGYGDEP